MSITWNEEEEKDPTIGLLECPTCGSHFLHGPEGEGPECPECATWREIEEKSRGVAPPTGADLLWAAIGFLALFSLLAWVWGRS